MKTARLTKMALVAFALTGLAACGSSTGTDDGTPQERAERTEGTAARSSAASSPAAPSRQSRGAAPRSGAADERAGRAALATRVFYFDFDVAEFRPSDRETLVRHARELAANPGRRVRLEGHADERGTREYNLALGERRAGSVMNYLIVNGAGRGQIELVSYGEERPADRGTSETAYQRNRRVELVDP